MNNYEVVWEIPELSIDLMTIVAAIFALMIGITKILGPMFLYIISKENREADDIKSIIRWILPLLIAVFFVHMGLTSGTTYVAKEYYNGRFSIDEGVVEYVDCIQENGFRIKLNGREYYLIDYFPSKRLNIEGCYVKIFYIPSIKSSETESSERYVAKIEYLQ